MYALPLTTVLLLLLVLLLLSHAHSRSLRSKVSCDICCRQSVCVFVHVAGKDTNLMSLYCNAAESVDRPTENFTISEPQNPPTCEFYLVRKR